MIVVDSSVWIDHFSGRATRETAALDDYLAKREVPVLVGDIVMYEVLAGTRSARALARIRVMFEGLLLVSMLGFELVPKAVTNYQALRRRGVTLGTVDMIVGTWCIENGAALLTADRNFRPMADHLGLRLA